MLLELVSLLELIVLLSIEIGLDTAWNLISRYKLESDQNLLGI